MRREDGPEAGQVWRALDLDTEAEEMTAYSFDYETEEWIPLTLEEEKRREVIDGPPRRPKDQRPGG
jgi:hypothetical protein